MTDTDHVVFLRLAVEEAVRHARAGGGGPFAALVVKDGAVIASGCNQVTTTNDPTAHAEVQAIRSACGALGDFQLLGCDVYCSCEPCPMCLGALYWARPRAVYFAATRTEAAAAGFDDAFIYEELAKPHHAARTLTVVHVPLPVDDGQAPFETPFAIWAALARKVRY